MSGPPLGLRATLVLAQLGILGLSAAAFFLLLGLLASTTMPALVSAGSGALVPAAAAAVGISVGGSVVLAAWLARPLRRIAAGPI